MISLRQFFIVILTMTLLLPVMGTVAQVARPTVAATDSVVKPNMDTAEDIQDFTPGLGLFAFIAICIILGVVFLFFVLAAFCILLFLTFIAAGIISTAVAVGIAQRSVSKGFKVLVLSGSGLLGLLVGAVGFLLLNQVFDLHFKPGEATGIGGVSGLAGGLIIGYILYRIALMIAAYLKKKYKAFL